jgi:hypothetical protein
MKVAAGISSSPVLLPLLLRPHAAAVGRRWAPDPAPHVVSGAPTTGSGRPQPASGVCVLGLVGERLRACGQHRGIMARRWFSGGCTGLGRSRVCDATVPDPASQSVCRVGGVTWRRRRPHEPRWALWPVDGAATSARAAWGAPLVRWAASLAMHGVATGARAAHGGAAAAGASAGGSVRRRPRCAAVSCEWWSQIRAPVLLGRRGRRLTQLCGCRMQLARRCPSKGASMGQRDSGVEDVGWRGSGFLARHSH